jgi:hypothetical protein
MLARSAESRLSTMTISRGAAAKSFFTRLLPTKPAPPTTRIFSPVNSFKLKILPIDKLAQPLINKTLKP